MKLSIIEQEIINYLRSEDKRPKTTYEVWKHLQSKNIIRSWYTAQRYLWKMKSRGLINKKVKEHFGTRKILWYV